MGKYTSSERNTIGKTYSFQTPEGHNTCLAVSVLIIFSLLCLLGQTVHSQAGKVQTPMSGPSLASSVQVLAQENKRPTTWNDAIRAVFPSDEAGRMIRICIKENRNQDKYATNYNKNGTYDYSWCQVNSVHKPASMSDESWQENLHNPEFHAKQVRAIYLEQGWNAWSVYKFGLVK